MTSKSKEKVLIGSVRSELQHEYCAEKRFYFAPAMRLTDIELPVTYVAMYHCLSVGTMGIDSYAKVRRTRLVKRKDIPFPLTRSNPDEDYYRFDLDRPQKLAEPIIFRDETVYGPRETTLGLLLDSTDTYELFLIKSEDDRKLCKGLKAAVSEYISDPGSEPSFTVNEYFHIKVSNGCIELLNRRERPVSSFSVNSYTEHPGEVFSEINGNIKRVLLALER